jgi:predicted short-subunit dehydrogenase-like oxidoreductase (DUF2520 family)
VKKKVVFIGAGKVAYHLSCALNKSGYSISGISSRKKSSAKKLAEKLGAQWSTKPENIIKEADIILITTPDSEIEKVSRDLCKKNVVRKKQLFMHTSGLLTSKILKCIQKQGGLTLSLHPAYSFSQRSFSDEILSGIWFVLEGDSASIEAGKAIVRRLKGKSLVIEPEKKPLYHLALVFASNFLISIEDIAIEILLKCGIKKSDALKLIKPLIEVTEKNIWEKGTIKALTGPVERGDVETIKKHLALLSKHKVTFGKAYIELSKHLLVMAGKKGNIEKEKIETIREILDNKKP